MEHITEQEWERYQGEVNAARRGLQDFHLRPLDEAIAAYRDEVTVTHQQLVDHDVDVVRRFVTRLIGRICAKGYPKAIPEVAAEFGYKEHLDILVPTMGDNGRKAVRDFIERVEKRLRDDGVPAAAYYNQILHTQADIEGVDRTCICETVPKPPTGQAQKVASLYQENEVLYKIVRCLSNLNQVQGQIVKWGDTKGLALSQLKARKDMLDTKLRELREELRQYE